MLFTGWLLRTFIDDKGVVIAQEMEHYDNTRGLRMSDLAAVTPYLAASQDQVMAAMYRDFKDNKKLGDLLVDLRSRPKNDGTGGYVPCRVLIQRF